MMKRLFKASPINLQEREMSTWRDLATLVHLRSIPCYTTPSCDNIGRIGDISYFRVCQAES